MNIVKNAKLIVLGGAKTPMRSTTGSAGYDIFAFVKTSVPSKGTATVNLPFHFEGDFEGKAAFAYVRSSFGIKKKIRLVGEDGLIAPRIALAVGKTDLALTLFNDADEDVVIEQGEHFAQFIVQEEKEEPLPLQIFEAGEDEKKKRPPIKGHLEEISANVHDYVLDEDIAIGAGEQKAVSSGYKGKIEPGTWFGMEIASPKLQRKLIFANGVPIIDYDYFDNADTDGNCIMAFVNVTYRPLILKAGDKLARWTAKRYFVFEDEIKTDKQRAGGIGHT